MSINIRENNRHNSPGINIVTTPLLTKYNLKWCKTIIKEHIAVTIVLTTYKYITIITCQQEEAKVCIYSTSLFIGSVVQSYNSKN